MVAQPIPRVAPENLQRSEIQGNLTVLAAQVVQFALYAVTAMVLARHIAPPDYGRFGIAFGVIAFLGLARDTGLVAPVIQSETLMPSQLDTLFWFSAGAGLLLTLVALAAAPLAGWVYADARLVPVTGALAFTLLAASLSTHHRALLRRRMRFSVIAGNEVLAAAAGCAAGIFAGTRGYGYWSLVWLHLTTESVRTALSMLAARWRPAWPKRGANVRPLLRVGGLVLAFDLIGYLNYQFDNLLIGWFLGPTALGFYDKAYQFLLLPVNQIGAPVSGVAQSALSAAQNDAAIYRASVRRCLVLTTGLGMPLTTFLCANADAVVSLAFGQRWLPSAPVFRALAPAAFLMTVTASMGWIYLSLGRARRQLPWSLFTTAVTLGAFFAGLKWGVTGVALGLSVSRIVLFLPTLIYTCLGTPVKWTDLIGTSSRPACAALASFLVSLGMGRWLGAGLWALAANALAFAAAYAVCWMLMPGGRALLRDSFIIPATARAGPARLRLGVITSEFFDPRMGRMGGSGWAARLLAQVFQQDSGARVEIVYLAREQHAGAGAEEVRVNGSRALLRRPSRFGNLRAVRRERFDLLLTIDYNRADTVYLRSAPRTPAIVWVRDPRTPEDVRKIHTLRIPGAESEEPQGLWCADCSSLAAIARESAWLQRKLIFATPALYLAGKLAAAYGIEPAEVHFLPNVIPIHSGKVTKSARPSVVFLGRLDPIKRPWIFAALAGRHSDADFLFLGQPHFQGPGSWRPADMPPNLRFAGHVGEEEKFRVLRAAWAVVNTSIHEGLAVAMLEALACEAPLVACQDPESVVSRYGISVGRYDGSGMESLDAFSGALQRLLDNPDLRRDLGVSGRAWVEATHSHVKFLESFARLCELAGAPAP